MDQALAQLTAHRSWWSPRVFEAFLRVVRQSAAEKLAREQRAPGAV